MSDSSGINLSTTKLLNIMENHGYIATKFYCADVEIAYIEFFCVANNQLFALYIPSKYSMPPPPDSEIIEIEAFDKSENDIIDEVSQDIEEITLQEEPLEDILYRKYNKPIRLTDINYHKEIARQVRRFGMGVKSLDYKLFILFNNFMATIKRDNSTSFFTIKNYTNDNLYKLMITLSLDKFYDHLANIHSEVETVRRGIYGIINNNHNNTVTHLKDLIATKINIDNYSTLAQKQKQEFLSSLSQFQSALEQTRLKEKSSLSALEKINNMQGVSDAFKDKERAMIHAEMTKLRSVKEKILENIISVKLDYENASLRNDILFFDTCIMLDKVHRNLQTINSQSSTIPTPVSSETLAIKASIEHN